MKQVEQITHIKCSLRRGEISEGVCVAGNAEDVLLCPFLFCYERGELFTCCKKFLKY